MATNTAKAHGKIINQIEQHFKKHDKLEYGDYCFMWEKSCPEETRKMQKPLLKGLFKIKRR